MLLKSGRMGYSRARGGLVFPFRAAAFRGSDESEARDAIVAYHELISQPMRDAGLFSLRTLVRLSFWDFDSKVFRNMRRTRRRREELSNNRPCSIMLN